MSIDIQFVSLVDDLQVIEALEVEGAVPRAIRLRSRGGFFDAQRVLINDYGVDTFTVVNDNFILVNPPSLFDSLLVTQMEFAVVSGSYTGGRSVRLLFGPTKNLRQVSGLQKLVQQVIVVLLSNANSNKFSLGEGGSLMQTLGSTLSPEKKTQITTSVSQAVSQTEEQVRAAQAQARGLQSNERLLSFTLTSVSFLSDRVQATLRLVTFAGRSIDLPLTL